MSSIQNVLRKLPIEAGERKTLPMMTGVLDYFPLAIAEIARVSKQGNDQHNPGQPLNWARGKSSDHADCIVRHLINRGEIDTDGMRHTAKAAWRALALLQEEMEAENEWTPNYGKEEVSKDCSVQKDSSNCPRKLYPSRADYDSFHERARALKRTF